jgi:lysophospholipase L1-like esterase
LESDVKPWRIAATVCAVLLVSGWVVSAGGVTWADGVATTGGHFYLALGGSEAVGVQPTAAAPEGRPTDDGYAEDLVDAARSKWRDLALVRLGCPGETTTTMLEGGGRCRYVEGSQLAAAVAFVHQHPTTVLVTVDLGFNDIRPCLQNQVVDQGCVNRALDQVRTQLPQIVAALRAAGGPSLDIIGVGHYDPYLRSYLDGPSGRSFATQSLPVLTSLNEVMQAAYNAAGVPMADVAAAFSMTDTESTTLEGHGLVPWDVARTCALTWNCTPPPLGPNMHPNDDGYRTISGTIMDALLHR